jgi:hypothetical protein
MLNESDFQEARQHFRVSVVGTARKEVKTNGIKRTTVRLNAVEGRTGRHSYIGRKRPRSSDFCSTRMLVSDLPRQFARAATYRPDRIDAAV